MIIAIDFDGTCVTHKYPAIGQDIGAAPVLLELIEAGHDLILYTIRDGKELKDAVSWFKWHKIPLFGINSNPDKSHKTTSPKIYADLYIDDSAVGCPIKYMDGIQRHLVDWDKMREILVNYGAL